MGIRVHKDLGYGIDNLKHGKKSYEMEDPRIDRKKFDDLHEQAFGMEGPELLKWMEKEKDALIEFHLKHHPVRKEAEGFRDMDFKFLYHQLENQIKEKKLPDFGSSVVWDGEFGCPNVLLFVPPTCPDWRRYDDIIDYCEETYKKGGTTNRYEFIKCSGIYPWSGRMFRFRDPKPGILKDDSKKDELRVMDATAYSQLIGWWDEKLKPVAQGDALKHFIEDYRPVLPIDVMVLLWYMKDAFKDVDSFVNELRPMIYVHWS